MENQAVFDLGPEFEFLEYISRGAYGIVVLARKRDTSEKFALKLLTRGENITRHVLREIVNHRKLDHPHIIGLIKVYYTDNYLILVLDYAAGGSLRDLLNKHPKGLDESECRRLFQHLMLAVDFCHKMGVTSRDIKPENLLLGHIEGDPNTQLKLADFGYSKDDTDSIARTKLGTPTHTAPEIMTSPQNQGYDSKRAEVWSCGVTLFELCTGQLPFRHPSDANLKHTQKMAKMMDRITSGAFEFPKDIPLSEQVKDLIRNMLVTDPYRRYAVKDVMKHPWFTVNLVPGALMINSMLVQESREYGPSDEEIDRIKAIVKEAETVPRRERSTSARITPPKHDDGTVLSTEF